MASNKPKLCDAKPSTDSAWNAEIARPGRKAYAIWAKYPELFPPCCQDYMRDHPIQRKDPYAVGK
jgi:hypothetical protein